MSTLVAILIELFIIAAVCGLLWWFIGFAAGKGVLKEPFVGLAYVLVAFIAVLLLINMLIGVGTGTPVVPLFRLR